MGMGWGNMCSCVCMCVSVCVSVCLCTVEQEEKSQQWYHSVQAAKTLKNTDKGKELLKATDMLHPNGAYSFNGILIKISEAGL